MSAEKLIEAALVKMRGRRQDAVNAIMQIKSANMQEVGERYVQGRSLLYGIERCIEDLEEAYRELTSPEGRASDPITQEKGPYE